MEHKQRRIDSKGDYIVIYVGVDVAKEKHDCCILGADGEVLKGPFSFANDRKGFHELLIAIQTIMQE